MTNKLSAVVPVLPTTNIQESISFYTEKLGFTLAFKWEDGGSIKYAGVTRDGLRLHLSGYFDEKIGKLCADQMTLRFDCTDVRSFYAECQKHEGVIHPNGPLEEKPWGSLEFAVIDPAGVCISFQQQDEA